MLTKSEQCFEEFMYWMRWRTSQHGWQYHLSPAHITYVHPTNEGWVYEVRPKNDKSNRMVSEETYQSEEEATSAAEYYIFRTGLDEKQTADCGMCFGDRHETVPIELLELPVGVVCECCDHTMIKAYVTKDQAGDEVYYCSKECVER